jgi:hypothetical protein
MKAINPLKPRQASTRQHGITPQNVHFISRRSRWYKHITAVVLPCLHSRPAVASVCFPLLEYSHRLLLCVSFIVVSSFSYVCFTCFNLSNQWPALRLSVVPSFLLLPQSSVSVPPLPSAPYNPSHPARCSPAELQLTLRGMNRDPEESDALSSCTSFVITPFH